MCGYLIEAFQYLKEAYKDEGKGLFIRDWIDKIRAKGLNFNRVSSG